MPTVAEIRVGVEKLFSMLGIELSGNAITALAKFEKSLNTQTPKNLMRMLFSYYDKVPLSAVSFSQRGQNSDDSLQREELLLMVRDYCSLLGDTSLANPVLQRLSEPHYTFEAFFENVEKVCSFRNLFPVLLTMVNQCARKKKIA